MPLLRYFVPGPRAVLALSLLVVVAGAGAATPEPYVVSRAQAATADCLRRAQANCEAALARYLELAAALLGDVRTAQTGQELRLRATRGQLQREAARLRDDATARLEPALQARAEGLERAIESIDALLGRRAHVAAVPLPPVASTVRVVEPIGPVDSQAEPILFPPEIAALPTLRPAP